MIRRGRHFKPASHVATHTGIRRGEAEAPVENDFQRWTGRGGMGFGSADFSRRGHRFEPPFPTPTEVSAPSRGAVDRPALREG